jgi:hypothetical protein
MFMISDGQRKQLAVMRHGQTPNPKGTDRFPDQKSH